MSNTHTDPINPLRTVPNSDSGDSVSDLRPVPREGLMDFKYRMRKYPLIPLFVAGTTGALLFGISRGFMRSTGTGNRWMQARVGFQALAIGAVAATIGSAFVRELPEKRHM